MDFTKLEINWYVFLFFFGGGVYFWNMRDDSLPFESAGGNYG